MKKLFEGLSGKFIPCLVSVLMLGGLSVQAQRPILEWEAAFGGEGSEIMEELCLTPSGGYIFAGRTWSNRGDINHTPLRAMSKGDGWVVMLDAARNILWSKCYGGTEDDQLLSIQPTADGNYIAAGFTESNNGHISGNHGSRDAWMIKLNSDGDTLWSKCYGGTGRDHFEHVMPTADGGYIAVGHTSSNDGDVSGNHGDIDAWVVKTDANGNIQWQKCYGGTAANIDPNYNSVPSDVFNKIRLLPDNSGYVIIGHTHSTDGDISSNNGGADYWVVKINLQGDVQWSKCYGSSQASGAFSISETATDILIYPRKWISCNRLFSWK